MPENSHPEPDCGADNVNHAQYGDNGTGVIVKTGGGERFQVGEDFQGLNQPAVGILRDMDTPTAYGNPDKVSSSLYSCSSGDSGGVHNNSGVPNHAHALAVDGGTFNGQTITGIGLTKAAPIWFCTESVGRHLRPTSPRTSRPSRPPVTTLLDNPFTC
jgi:Zn-dependent metalloprotease